MPIQYRVDLVNLNGFNITADGGSIAGIFEKMIPYVDKQYCYLSNFKFNGYMQPPTPCAVTRPLANRILVRVYPVYLLRINNDDTIVVTLGD